MNADLWPEWLQLLIVVWASYRITRFLVFDSLMGFGSDSGSRLSVRVDKFAYDGDGNGRSWWREYIGDLLTCVFCAGFWVSLAVWCAWTAVYPWDLDVQGVLTVFGVAGGQAFLNSRMNA